MIQHPLDMLVRPDAILMTGEEVTSSVSNGPAFALGSGEQCMNIGVNAVTGLRRRAMSVASLA